MPKESHKAQGQGMKTQKPQEKQELVQLLQQTPRCMSAEIEGDFSKREKLTLKARCGDEVKEVMHEAAEEFMK